MEKEIKVEFFENSEMIPDPKTLDPTLKNLIILDDCFLGKYVLKLITLEDVILTVIQSIYLILYLILLFCFHRM